MKSFPSNLSGYILKIPTHMDIKKDKAGRAKKGYIYIYISFSSSPVFLLLSPNGSCHLLLVIQANLDLTRGPDTVEQSKDQLQVPGYLQPKRC